MLPRFTMNYLPHSHLRKLKHSGELSVGVQTGVEQAPYFNYFGVVHFCENTFLSEVHPALCYGVYYVIFCRAQKQVFRVATRWVVAGVTAVEGLIEQTKSEFVCHPTCKAATSFVSEPPVTILVCSRQPRPTLVWSLLIHFLPETLRHRVSFVSLPSHMSRVAGLLRSSSLGLTHSSLATLLSHQCRRLGEFIHRATMSVTACA